MGGNGEGYLLSTPFRPTWGLFRAKAVATCQHRPEALNSGFTLSRAPALPVETKREEKGQKEKGPLHMLKSLPVLRMF